MRDHPFLEYYRRNVVESDVEKQLAESHPPYSPDSSNMSKAEGSNAFHVEAGEETVSIPEDTLTEYR